MHTHVSMITIVNEEQKTKPTQQAIKVVRSAGLNPDLVSLHPLNGSGELTDTLKIACRCRDKLHPSSIEKVAMFCHVEKKQVIAVHDVSSTYHVPMVLKGQGLIEPFTKILKIDMSNICPSLKYKGADLWGEWKSSTALHDYRETVTIALVGKYTKHADTYISVIKALEHSVMYCKRKLNLVSVDSEHLEEAQLDQASKPFSPLEHEKAWDAVRNADGILVPGGFGTRGTDGMVLAVEFARVNQVPFLGVCLGMQVAVIEYARNVCGIKATSEECEFLV